MEVDTLDYATEGVLSMKCKDRWQKPVAFLSKFLNETERDYEIHDKKMWTVIRELENWRHLLESANVVATTRWNGTCSLLTSAKLSVGYLVLGITRELDKESLLN